jgi:hypothetical protein
MRLESSEPKNESGFYARLRERTTADFFYERVEPANESGFPDLYFVRRGPILPPCEGTIELKFAKTKVPNLRSLCRGNQKAALLEYFEGGGRRRFALCYGYGEVFLWDTSDYRRALRQDNAEDWTAKFPLEHPDFSAWLLSELET